jgi:PAS domain S-box-containing protein
MATVAAPEQPEDVRTNARLLSLIYDHTSDPVYLVAVEGDEHYRFVSVNEAFLRVSGYQVDQVVNAPMERVVPPANVDLVRAQYRQTIATRQPVTYEERAELPAGTRYAEITLIPVHDGAGPVTHILADIRDMTARRVAELERARLLGDAVFLSDATRLLASLDVEQALADVARLSVPYLGDGCAVDLLEEEGPRRVVTVARDPAAPMAEAIHPDVLRGSALTYRPGDASCLGVPLLVKGHPTGAITLRGEPGRSYGAIDLALVEELGRRAALAVENARLYWRAEEALRARDEFLAVAAHELRGPITSIHLAVQAVLQRKLPPDALSQALELIEREDRRLSRFVGELLDLGRLRAGRLQLHLEEVELGAVVQDVVQRVRQELAASGSTLALSIAPGVVGEWDRFRLEQLVGNLLSNAIKFGLGRPIEISLVAVGGRAHLAVRDHGIGVDPGARERIFLPFERNVPSRNYGGLGLGLHIVKTIVGALGGTVGVEGEPGAGTTFTVVLPLRRGESTDAHPGH